MPQLAPERIIEVRRITVFQIPRIDIYEATFKAHIYLEFAIVDGAGDEPLAVKENTMTKGVTYQGGLTKWPVVPSALWYLENQLNFANAIELDVKECKVLTDKWDLVLIKRVMGEFSVLKSDMQDFPFDAQALCFCCEWMCARNGPFPVRLVKTPATQFHVMSRNFMPTHSWELVEYTALETYDAVLNDDQTRTYPAFRAIVQINRRWGNFVLRCALPRMAFSLISIALSISLPSDRSRERLGLTLALFFAAFAYPSSVGSCLPPTTKTPLLDKYQASCLLVQGICAFRDAMLSVELDDGSLLFSSTADFVSVWPWVMLPLWVVVHAVFVIKAAWALGRRRKQMLSSLG